MCRNIINFFNNNINFNYIFKGGMWNFQSFKTLESKKKIFDHKVNQSYYEDKEDYIKASTHLHLLR